MSAAKTICSPLMDSLPTYEFRKCVHRYNGNYKVKRFSCWNQFLFMAFAQLTFGVWNKCPPRRWLKLKFTA
jgi:hypothetical protein